MNTKIIIRKLQQIQQQQQKCQKRSQQRKFFKKYSIISSVNKQNIYSKIGKRNYGKFRPLSSHFVLLICFFICFGNNCFPFKTANAMPLLHLLRMYSSGNNNNQNGYFLI